MVRGELQDNLVRQDRMASKDHQVSLDRLDHRVPWGQLDKQDHKEKKAHLA
jgi:hypothetical protein